jgi:threonine synthase
LLLGLVRGFRNLQRAGFIDRVPYAVGVQAAACAPLVAAMQHGLEAMENIAEGQTLAEGVRVRRPVRAEALSREIPAEAGQIVSVPEEKIVPAFHALAQRGIYAEPTSALVWAAFEQLAGKIPEPILLIVSGSGLKLGQHLN